MSVWDWLNNPIDFSIREDDSLSMGLILEMMARNPNFDLLITLMGATGRVIGQPGVSLDVYLRQQYRLETCRTKPFLAVVPERSLGSQDWDSREGQAICELRTALINLNIPFYPTVQRAASAAKKLFDYYQRQD